MVQFLFSITHLQVAAQIVSMATVFAVRTGALLQPAAATLIGVEKHAQILFVLLVSTESVSLALVLATLVGAAQIATNLFALTAKVELVQVPTIALAILDGQDQTVQFVAAPVVAAVFLTKTRKFMVLWGSV